MPIEPGTDVNVGQLWYDKAAGDYVIVEYHEPTRVMDDGSPCPWEIYWCVRYKHPFTWDSVKRNGMTEGIFEHPYMIRIA